MFLALNRHLSKNSSVPGYPNENGHRTRVPSRKGHGRRSPTTASQKHQKMKVAILLRLVLAFGLFPAALGAQSPASETANYFAEFADLMHAEMDAQATPVAATHTNRFPAFVHFREVVKGKAEDFPAYYEKIAPRSVPPAKTMFANRAPGQGCPHDAMVFDCTVFTNLPIEECSGRQAGK
jgi:hypothetical protein